jgi:hypothetical protein
MRNNPSRRAYQLLDAAAALRVLAADLAETMADNGDPDRRDAALFVIRAAADLAETVADDVIGGNLIAHL